MALNATVAAIRYGYGFAPNEAAPGGKNDLLAQLENQRPGIVGVGMTTQASLDFLVKLRRVRKKRSVAAKTTKKTTAAKAMNKQMAGYKADILRLRVMDMLAPQSGFLERLVSFWADHFAVSSGKSVINRLLAGAFVEEAIRPNITRSFPDMLKDVMQHPAMLEFLDQNASVGPASKVGRKKGRGLNENLARELLELHTLGVHGGYTQKDVRQLAELLTGLTFRKTGFLYNKKFAEPGAEHVLGHVYGEAGEHLDNILAFLDDVARHPDTARHIARKLVVHFVSDIPDVAHVAQVADVFFRTNGDFMSTYEALLGHPNAWVPLGGKVKRPFEFVISGLRSFGLDNRYIGRMKNKELRHMIAVPLALMGQRFMQPLGPDGWPEEAEHWITPQGLAARIHWANLAVKRYGAGLDPRDFVGRTLHDFAGPEVILAASRAEVRSEGLALILASPEFNRR